MKLMKQMTILNYIQQGIDQKIIEFSDDDKRIMYCYLNKSRNYHNPEEKVQAETYCRLIFEYHYPPHRIDMFVNVTMGVERKEADIVVYKDDARSQPYILIECKKEQISEAEFKQAEDQAYSYAFALPSSLKWIWVTSKIKNAYFQFNADTKSHQSVADIPLYGVHQIPPYKFVKGVDSENGHDKFSELKIVEERELNNRFKQAHNALWAGGQLNPSEAFDEFNKLVFCKIRDERKPRKSGQPYDFQIITVEGVGSNPQDIEANAIKQTNAALLQRIQALYEEGRKEDPEVFRDGIRLTPERVRTIVEYLQEVNLSKTDLDSKGRAFETFMGEYFRGNFGQYFTPRPIVKFIVDVLPIEANSLVLDTSCGSGGFLLHALEKIRQQADEFYPKQDNDHYRYWHDFASKRLYGIEINEQISRAAKMNMIIHDDGHTNVITSDGLLRDETLQTHSKNLGFAYGRFDFIITNPPFGSAVKLTEQAYLSTYGFGQKDTSWLDLKNTGVKNRDSQSTEVLFIEQCHQFLKAGGYLAIVIPDGILTNSSLQYVRDQIEDWYRLVAVVSLPQTAFTATGAGVKSSVLFLRKYSKEKTKILQNLKLSLQDTIKAEYNYNKEIERIERTKKRIIDNAEGLMLDDELKNFKKTDTYKTWKAEKTAEFNEQINELKEKLEDTYQQRRQNELPDYAIFMAIAEDIGYDATGKATGTNELDSIGVELARFITEEVQHETF